MVQLSRIGIVLRFIMTLSQFLCILLEFIIMHIFSVKPSPVQDLQAVALGPSRILVSWDRHLLNDNGVKVLYKVNVTSDDDDQQVHICVTLNMHHISSYHTSS